MARTTPAAQVAHAESTSFSTHKRVQVRNGSGTWINLSSLQGYNWIDELEYGVDIDNPWTATIKLFREVGALSLAPFMETSVLNRLDDGTTYSPLLDVAREIKIEGATLASGATPASGDWQLFFHGYIDEVQWPELDSRATLICTDLTARLRDTFIETPATYGASGGVLVETVGQSILTDNATGVTLYTPTSPGFNITRYTPAGVSVLEALQRLLNDTTGWPIRSKYDSGTGTFRITLVDPQRSKTVPDKTLPASFYSNVTQLGISLQGIRNKWTTFYTDATTGLRAFVTDDDSASMLRYGGFYRTAEIEEGNDSPIDTAAEATRMNDAALADTKDPLATMEIESLWYPWVELNDLERFTANGIHFDTDQDLAVVGIRHKLGPVLENGEQDDLTYLLVRGTPAGQYTRWLAKDSRLPDQRTQSSGTRGYPVLTFQSETATTTTVRVTAADTVGTVEYSWRQFRLNTAAGAFSAWAALGAFQDVVVTRNPHVIQVLEVKIRDANGESFTVPFYVDPEDPQIIKATGAVTRSTTDATLISNVVSKLQNDGDLAPNINADGDVFIPSTNRAKIGASGAPATVTITNRINFAEFSPASKNEDYDSKAGPYLANSVANIVNVGILTAPLLLPEGAVLTEITPLWYAYDNANANVALRLDKISSGGATNLATLSDSTTGWHGAAFSLSETISGSFIYMFEVSVSAAIVAGARFLWVQYKYTIDDYLKQAS